MVPRIVVIGDIHGCCHTLVTLLTQVNLNTNTDRIVFLGDYIDRGLYSKDVIRTIRELQEAMPEGNCTCLRGNHEQMAIEFDGSTDLWEANGGYATMWSYRDDHEQFVSDVKWFMTLPFAAQDSNHIYAHAGLSYPLLDDCTPFDLLWDRSWLKAPTLLKREKPVVFGHTPFRDIAYLPNGDIGIDCGCGSGGMLCAVSFEEDGRITEYKVKRDDRDSDQAKIREMLTWYNNQ